MQKTIEEEINAEGFEDQQSPAKQGESKESCKDSLVIKSLDATKKGQKQLIYDAKLDCYYDPETKEYFQLKH